MTPPYADHRERGGYDTDELDALTSDTQDARRGGKRFVVQTVTGYLIKFPLRQGTAPRRTPGLSAHVLDTTHACRVVGTWRSEDRGSGAGGFVGATAALIAANALAERLNRDAA